MSELQAAVARQAESSQSSSSPSEEEAAKLRSELSRRREAATAAAAECNMLRTEAKQAEKKAEGMAEELMIVYIFCFIGKIFHFILSPFQSKRKFLDLSKAHTKLKDRVKEMEEEGGGGGIGFGRARSGSLLSRRNKEKGGTRGDDFSIAPVSDLQTQNLLITCVIISFTLSHFSLSNPAPRPPTPAPLSGGSSPGEDSTWPQ